MDALAGSSSLVRHVRAPTPLVFAVEADMPESRRHLMLRTFLFTTFERAFGGGAAIGSEQFLYFRASDPRKPPRHSIPSYASPSRATISL